jgi:hypothetical protein
VEVESVESVRERSTTALAAAPVVEVDEGSRDVVEGWIGTVETDRADEIDVRRLKEGKVMRGEVGEVEVGDADIALASARRFSSNTVLITGERDTVSEVTVVGARGDGLMV